MLLDFIHYMKNKSAHLVAIHMQRPLLWNFVIFGSRRQPINLVVVFPASQNQAAHVTKKMIAAAMQSQHEFAQVFTHSVTADNPEIPRNKAIIKATKRTISNLSPKQIDIFFENSIRLLVHNPSNIENIKIPCTVCVGEYDTYATKDIAYYSSSN
ncbi:hypothetical protein P4S72_15460 [Vibrio sp. PP-XX7]